VYLVPDGSLNLVSFASLPVGESLYLVEREPILHYLGAERDLPSQPLQPAPNTGLLALGAPDFDVDPGTGPSLAGVVEEPPQRGSRPACGDFRALRFEPLPASAHEVTEVAALWRNRAPNEHEISVLTGAQASKTALRIRARGHRVLHLATHGFFLGEGCPSALRARAGLRGIGGFKVPGTAPVLGDSPLLLSGLALAGSNRRERGAPPGDDGILTAEEAAALDLSGTEWAVLSGCETGMGQVQSGEGVLGLRRAFELAGARTVIMSLWSVEDESARQWMRTLYEARLNRGSSTIEAVRSATLSTLLERRARGESTHPFYWAAFVAAGDWR
jgi:CHAT domain-containing protein